MTSRLAAMFKGGWSREIKKASMPVSLEDLLWQPSIAFLCLFIFYGRYCVHELLSLAPGHKQLNVIPSGKVGRVPPFYEASAGRACCSSVPTLSCLIFLPFFIIISTCIFWLLSLLLFHHTVTPSSITRVGSNEFRWFLLSSFIQALQVRHLDLVSVGSPVV